MVNVYGVTHGFEITSITGTQNCRLTPSDGFLSSLERLSGKRRIGLETLSYEDWYELDTDLAHLGREACLELHPRFDHSSDMYWNVLEETCKKRGHEVFFIEDVNVWKEYNLAVIAAAKKRERNIYFHKGESELNYHKRLVQHNTGNRKAHLMTRKIHEIDRDNALLKAIKDYHLDDVIVGVGHSDYWMLHQQDILNEFGVSFNNYATERWSFEFGFPMSHFLQHDISPPEVAYERDSLNRNLRVAQGKRISDKKPDYIGTWDVVDPLEGYFELFVEERDANGCVFGRVEDCLGSARFNGELREGEFTFTKHYIPGRCVADAVHKPIRYNGRGRDGQYTGYFYVTDFGVAFYLTQNVKETPLQMAVQWCQLNDGKNSKGVNI